MLLKGKVGMIHGASGAVGGAFGREGARLFLNERTLGPVEAVASDIDAAGGTVEAAVVDALDEEAVERYAAEVASKAGRIDALLNATGSGAVQGIPLIDLKREDFASPIET